MLASAGMTLIHSTPLDFKEAKIDGLKPLPFERGAFAGPGTLESPEIAAPQPFDNLVGSWNADLPKGASIELHVQVKTETGERSGWYGLGRWDGAGGRSLGKQDDAIGWVDVDTLKLKKKAVSFRYRATLERKAVLRKLAFTFLDMTAAPAVSTSPFRAGPWVRELNITPRSQMEEQDKYKSNICSPTSLSMVLEFWGVRKKTVDVALMVQDRESQLFGNWPLNVACAANAGLSGYVARLGSFDAAQEIIASGRPLVASITFGKEELSGAPIKSTSGHLLVIAGFTESGDVIAVDPASKTRGEARRIYKRAEFAKAWLGKKRGLVYVIGPRFPVPMVAVTPTVDLLKKPGGEKATDTMNPNRLTQLLYGEKVLALEADGDWVKVEAVEQDAFKQQSKWKPYTGWVRADALTEVAYAGEPGAVVAARRLVVPGGPTLSMGTKLPVDEVLKEAHTSGKAAAGFADQAIVRLLDGRAVAVPLADVRLLDSPFLDFKNPPSRSGILAAAERFIDDTYVWGGRSGAHADPAWGVDCSGLVNLSYRVEGIDLPRDAHDQFLKAKPVRRAELKPGDLIFLGGRDKDAERITHVMLYAGGDDILESRSPKAVRTTFRKNYGKPLTDIESGDTVEDLSAAKPFKRTIRFGAFLAPDS
ncbi:MAG: C39 family peptidase [Elusimicrobia bacterium]|nr:C39 family peptidase [Elusimicrobiota bacterium]